MKSIHQSLKIIALSLILSFGISFIYAWTGPTAIPPAGNVDAPINTSANKQTKAGTLYVNEALGVGGIFSGFSGASFSGAVIMEEGSQIQLKDFASTTVGFIQGVNNQIQFQNSGGVAKMTIDTSSNKVSIGTTAAPGTLEVAGEIKSSGITLGNSSSICSNTNKGLLRYNSTTNKLEYCNGTSYKTVSDTLVYLVNSLHNEDQCTGLGGVVAFDGAGNGMCKFQAASCPVGWSQYNNWSTTQNQSAGYVNKGCGGTTCTSTSYSCPSLCTTNNVTCSSGSHAWSNTPAESKSCTGTSAYTGKDSDNTYAVWKCDSSPSFVYKQGYCLGTNVTVTSPITEIGCY